MHAGYPMKTAKTNKPKNQLLSIVWEGPKIHSIMKQDKKKKKSASSFADGNEFPDYPLYPSSEDIYSQYTEEDIDPDLNMKENINKPGKLNEKDFEEDMSGEDLDIPGAELDDYQEEIGSEDEENNYYSLGGDNHEDLSENKGD
jgi:hypothetical protein